MDPFCSSNQISDSFIVDAGITNSELGSLTNAADGVVVIPGLQEAENDGISGSVFSEDDNVAIETMIDALIEPFIVTHTTSTTDTASGNRGFKLQYQQVPC